VRVNALRREASSGQDEEFKRKFCARLPSAHGDGEDLRGPCCPASPASAYVRDQSESDAGYGLVTICEFRRKPGCTEACQLKFGARKFATNSNLRIRIWKPNRCNEPNKLKNQTPSCVALIPARSVQARSDQTSALGSIRDRLQHRGGVAERRLKAVIVLTDSEHTADISRCYGAEIPLCALLNFPETPPRHRVVEYTLKATAEGSNFDCFSILVHPAPFGFRRRSNAHGRCFYNEAGCRFPAARLKLASTRQNVGGAAADG